MHWTWWHFAPPGHCDDWWQPGTHSLGPPQPSQTFPVGHSVSALHPRVARGGGAGVPVSAGGEGGGGCGAGAGAGAAQPSRARVARASKERSIHPSFPGAVLEQSTI